MTMLDSHPPTVLVVEDSDEDYTALVRAFRRVSQPVRLIRCENGADALEMLALSDTAAQSVQLRPSLVLLDLNLPAADGRDILRQIKASAHARQLPVVVLTTSSNPEDIEQCYDHGASGYLVKAVDFDVFMQSIHVLCTYWFKTVKLPDAAEVRI